MAAENPSIVGSSPQMRRTSRFCDPRPVAGLADSAVISEPSEETATIVVSMAASSRVGAWDARSKKSRSSSQNMGSYDLLVPGGRPSAMVSGYYLHVAHCAG